MQITVICTGKLKERYWTDAAEEYGKRLSKYCLLSIIETKEEKSPESLSSAEENLVKETEGKNILKHIKDDMTVFALEIKGKKMSSEALADKINSLAISGKSNLAFIIGGSLGLSKEVLSRADYLLSFSDMTFPHQLMRVILLEQIYRSFRIIRGEPYHK